MPDFWLALLAIGLLVTAPKVYFHLDQPIFYSIGLHSEGKSGINLDYFRHLALPVFVLIATSVASWSRFERASMLEVLNSDYVRTARAKGVPRRKVIYKHALRNALIPFTTVTALDTAALIGGVIIIEQIFSITGMGQSFLIALQAGDAQFLLAWFFFTAIAVIGMNLIADVMLVVLDLGSGSREHRAADHSGTARRARARIRAGRAYELAIVPAPVLPPPLGAPLHHHSRDSDDRLLRSEMAGAVPEETPRICWPATSSRP